MKNENLKKRILYLHRTQGKGAEGSHIRGMVDAFRGKGFKVDIIGPPGIDPYDECKAGNSRNGRQPLAKSIWWKLSATMPQVLFEPMEIVYNLHAYLRARQKLRRQEYDFIYERYAFFNFAGAFISNRKNIPLVVEVNELSGHKRIRGQFFVRVCSAIEKYVLRQAVVVVTVSGF